MEKPHKGTIRHWEKHPCRDGLGYCVYGVVKGHPQWGEGFIRTSFVVKRDGNEIETNNSRYTLEGSLHGG